MAERLYVFLDRWVATRADSVWTMSYAMLEGREAAGRFQRSEVTVRLAPMGNYAHLIHQEGRVAHNRRDLVFIGNPNAKNVRADLMLDVARVLADQGCEFRLIYVGPGDTSHLQARAKELRLSDRVVFRGSIADAVELDRMMASFGIGLAPYDPNLEGNFSKYADPAKIKVYLGCGLPVISSDVPVIARELQAQGAGFVADFSSHGFAEKIKPLLEDESLYQRVSARAEEIGASFAWPRIFDRLVQEEGLDRR
jgi:glycosyltransferase involved in cell wall biosynthesis